MSDYKYTFVLLLVVTAMIIAVLWQVGNKMECDDRGGDYVMGLFGYTCVGEDTK